LKTFLAFLRNPLSYDENAVVDLIEKVSKSVVNISTIRLVQNIFYQAVPVGDTGSDTIIDKDGLILTPTKLDRITDLALLSGL